MRIKMFNFISFRTRNNFNLICLLQVLSLTLVLRICEGLYAKNGINYNELSNSNLSVPVCLDIPDEKKFDCYPDAPVKENDCVSRGCCFSVPKSFVSSSSLPPLNVPYCYYPSNYKGYSITGIFKTSRRIRIKLERVQPSGFPKDSNNVNVLVSYLDDNSLRIKVYNDFFSLFIINYFKL